MNFKNSIFSSGVGALVMVSMLVPQVMFAQGKATSTKENKGPKDANYCLKIDDIISKGNDKLSQKISRFETNKNDRLNKKSTNRDVIDARKDELRNQVDSQRADHFQKLEDRATTTAEKAAVDAFKKAIVDAVAVRRNAVDTLLAKFRADVDLAITTRKGAVESAINNYKTEVQSVLNKAKTDCANGVSPVTIKANVKAGLQAAKTTLSTAVNSLEKVGPNVAVLAQTRKDAHAKIIETFKASTEKARADLKAAFQSA